MVRRIFKDPEALSNGWNYLTDAKLRSEITKTEDEDDADPPPRNSNPRILAICRFSPLWDLYPTPLAR